MKKGKKIDYILFAASFLLIVLGILILNSVSSFLSLEKFGDTYSFSYHQMVFGLIPGLILGLAAFKMPLEYLRKISFPLILLNIFLLAMVFIPKVGFAAKGASRWMDLGFFSFQPSEFLKLNFILYLSAWLSSRVEFPSFNPFRADAPSNKKSKHFTEIFLFFLAIIGAISVLLIAQPDISTLGIIILTSVTLYFLAYTPFWHTTMVILGGLAGLIVLIGTADYRIKRLQVLMGIENDPLGTGYHINQALIAIGSGGLLGLGLGFSRQKFGFLPESIGDSIFAIFSEETGFIGAFILVALFVIFAWRGISIAKKSNEKFYQLLAAGITCWIIIQAFLNISSTIGIFPIAGVPLPFISYGGSHLTAELIGIGILLNISKNA